MHPALEPSDMEASVLANSARLSAEVLVDYLRAVEAGTAGPGIEQPGRGRYYRFDDRRVWHDAHHLLQRKVLRRRPPKRPAHVERYYLPPPAPEPEPDHGR